MLTGEVPVVASVKGTVKPTDEADTRGAAYEPTPASKLRPTDEPPPLPAAADETTDGFGAADEDGLRMLAALETLSSLEPDYAVDLAIEEASVTIIESFGYDAVAEALGTGDPSERYGRGQADACGAPALLLNGYETFTGFGEEASVEIVEIGPTFEEEAARRVRPAEQPASLTERLAKTGRVPRGRFFKALSGN